ncbi:MAG TPA: hypothetical protein PLM60_05055 [Methanoregulaceae archaeon]|jgi:hypothetical protein|nr:hypothetical protein [Methanoregulaceae archaeon]HNW80874.1 hypothetical protein [Methanoregulaceae archaeon]HOU81392.1 hypothetical protein [Methanoregulaceae archaeon]HPS22756.1 hypothetical protein [Methanoregulaceae archaeon]
MEEEFAENQAALAVIDMIRREIAQFRKYSDYYRYLVFLLRNI